MPFLPTFVKTIRSSLIGYLKTPQLIAEVFLIVEAN